MKLIKLLNNKYGFAIPDDAPQQIKNKVSQAVDKLPSSKQISAVITEAAEMTVKFKREQRDKDHH